MLPNLYKNRHGTYYLRITIDKREIKRSLGTKEPARAKLAATAFAWIRAMDLKKPFPYELPMGLDPDKLRELGVILPNGTRFTDIETDDDARRVAMIMKAAGAGASSDDILDLLRVPVPGGMPLQKRAAALMGSLAEKAPGKSKPFSAVSELYLDEHALTAKAKGVEDRRSTYTMSMDASAIAHEIRMIRKVARLFEQLRKHGIKLSTMETKDAIAKIRSGTTPSTVESQLRESKKSASAPNTKPKPSVSQRSGE